MQTLRRVAQGLEPKSRDDTFFAGADERIVEALLCVGRQHLLKRFAGACQLGKLALLLHLCQFLLHGSSNGEGEAEPPPSLSRTCERGADACCGELARHGPASSVPSCVRPLITSWSSPWPSRGSGRFRSSTKRNLRPRRSGRPSSLRVLSVSRASRARTSRLKTLSKRGRGTTSMRHMRRCWATSRRRASRPPTSLNIMPSTTLRRRPAPPCCSMSQRRAPPKVQRSQTPSRLGYVTTVTEGARR
mmetsp:Transcript_40567/g.131272  ORF Transcript_40567/g.131272 Transcript_40567/m.131272 type:complete len:246 (+) Transcript_40567:636-1373(+)